MDGVGKAYGPIRALEGINLTRQRRRGRLRPRRQRRRQVHAHQDHVRPAPAQRGHPAGRRPGGALLARRASRSTTASRPSTRTWPSSRSWRCGATSSSAPSCARASFPLAPLDIPKMRAVADTELKKMGIARQGHQPADRHAVRRPAAVRRHRPGRLLRRPRADPRRAHRRARRQAVRRRAQVHGGRPRRRPRRRVHHAQPAPRLHGRRPLHHPQARQAGAGQASAPRSPSRSSPPRWPAARSSPSSRTSSAASVDAPAHLTTTEGTAATWY